MLQNSVQWLRWASSVVKVTGGAEDQSFIQALRGYVKDSPSASARAETAAGELAESAAELFKAAHVSADQLAEWLDGRTLLDRWTQTGPGRNLAREDLPSLRRWLDFLAALEPLSAAGLAAAREQLKSGTIEADDAVTAFERGLSLASQQEQIGRAHV